MHKFYIYIIITLFFTGCQSELNKKDESQINIKNSPKEYTIESVHHKCTVEKLYYHCKALAFLYADGGLYDGKKIKKDPAKAKEYFKILCEETKKEYYCKELNK